MRIRMRMRMHVGSQPTSQPVQKTDSHQANSSQDQDEDQDSTSLPWLSLTLNLLVSVHVSSPTFSVAQANIRKQTCERLVTVEIFVLLHRDGLRKWLRVSVVAVLQRHHQTSGLLSQSH